ncbi:MAG: adenylate kinase [Candidatus Woesearchaeota archaeon]
MRIVILGPQGSGKGTQADMVSKRFNIPRIEAGALLREQVAKKTEIGKKIEKPMMRGELVPPRYVDELIKQRLSLPDARKGFVIDGYPRQLEQAEFLDSIADIDAVIVLEIPDEVGIRRISGRRTCKKCGAVFTSEAEKCSDCGGELFQRADDKPEIVRERLRHYHEETEPLMEYYKPRDIVHVIDGTGTVEEVFRLIMQALS